MKGVYYLNATKSYRARKIFNGTPISIYDGKSLEDAEKAMVHFMTKYWDPIVSSNLSPEEKKIKLKEGALELKKARNDPSGSVVNGWKIIEQAEHATHSSGSHLKKWKAQCIHCGRVVTRPMGNLKRTECRCQHNYHLPRKTEDLSGKKIGMLTVLRRVYPDSEYHFRGALYECQCDCGNKCLMTTASLKQQSKKYPRNCGCIMKLPKEERKKFSCESEELPLKKRNIQKVKPGDVYHTYEVLEIVGQRTYPSGQKQTECKVRCNVCGVERVMSTTRAKKEICKHGGTRNRKQS